MKEDLLVPYYSKIANQLNDIIPVEWYDIVLYGEELGDVRTAMFYFRTKENSEYIAGGKIPKLYNVDSRIYLSLISQLYEQIKELKHEFMKQNMKEWKTLTFWLNSDFKFKIDFAYEINMEADSYARGVYWAYKTLGIVPQDSFERQFLNEYLSKYE